MDATSHVRVSDAGATTSLLPTVLTRIFFGLVARRLPTEATPWRGTTAGHGRHRGGNRTRPAAT